MVWHIEKETKEGLGVCVGWGREARMVREKLRVRRGTQTVRKEDTGKEVETEEKARETKKTKNVINKI